MMFVAWRRGMVSITGLRTSQGDCKRERPMLHSHRRPWEQEHFI